MCRLLKPQATVLIVLLTIFVVKLSYVTVLLSCRQHACLSIL